MIRFNINNNKTIFKKNDLFKQINTIDQKTEYNPTTALLPSDKLIDICKSNIHSIVKKKPKLISLSIVAI